jgi:predicted Zn-ribbon and HTH transcriptional regulator
MANAYETGRVLKEFRCLSCNWTWFQRKHDEVPRQCPHCKSARWQIGKLRRDENEVLVPIDDAAPKN